MNRAVLRAAAGFLALAATGAQAADRRPSYTTAWFGLGVGMVNGSVELPCRDTGSGGRKCGESGLFPSYHLDLTVAGPVGAVRIRGVRAEEETRHRPRELAMMVGARLSHRWSVFLGRSSIRHADNDYDGNATGLAWEFVKAHRSRDNAASYWSIMGATGSDVDYVGISVGLRLGDLR